MRITTILLALCGLSASANAYTPAYDRGSCDPNNPGDKYIAFVAAPRSVNALRGLEPTVTGNSWKASEGERSASVLTDGLVTDTDRAYRVGDGTVLTYAFDKPKTIYEFRFVCNWGDVRRTDIVVASIESCDEAGNWTRLDGSAFVWRGAGSVPYGENPEGAVVFDPLNTACRYLRFFAEDGSSLAQNARGLRVTFGAQDALYDGCSEIEALTVPPAEKATSYPVDYLDWKGDVIASVTVEKGASAAAPEVTAPDGFAFAGWSEAATDVQRPMEIRATYAATEGALMIAQTDWGGVKPSSINLLRQSSTTVTLQNDHALNMDFQSRNQAVGVEALYDGVIEKATGSARYWLGDYAVLRADFASPRVLSNVLVAAEGATAVGFDGVYVKLQESDDYVRLPISAMPEPPNLYGRRLYLFGRADGNALAENVMSVELRLTETERTAAEVVEVEMNGLPPVKNTYIVRFYDGETLLKEEEVARGADATPPATLPVHEGYIFDRWSGSYVNVTDDLSLKAVYLSMKPVLTSEIWNNPESEDFSKIFNALTISGTRFDYEGETIEECPNPAVMTDNIIGWGYDASVAFAVQAVEWDKPAVLTWELARPSDISSIRIYTGRDGGRSNLEIASIKVRTKGSDAYEPVFDTTYRSEIAADGLCFVLQCEAGIKCCLAKDVTGVKIEIPWAQNGWARIQEVQAISWTDPDIAWTCTAVSTTETIDRRSVKSLLAKPEVVKNVADNPEDVDYPDNPSRLGYLWDRRISGNCEADYYFVGDYSTFTYAFPRPARIDSLGFWNYWYGRSGVVINGVQVKFAKSDRFIPLPGLSAEPYDSFDHWTSDMLHFELKNAKGTPLAENVEAVRITFGRTENGFVGMQEAEVCGALAPLGFQLLIK